MDLCFQGHNILMDEHNEYLLHVYGGMFEVVLKHELLPMINLYFREYRLDTTRNNKPRSKDLGGDIYSL